MGQSQPFVFVSAVGAFGGRRYRMERARSHRFAERPPNPQNEGAGLAAQSKPLDAGFGHWFVLVFARRAGQRVYFPVALAYRGWPHMADLQRPDGWFVVEAPCFRPAFYPAAGQHCGRVCQSQFDRFGGRCGSFAARFAPCHRRTVYGIFAAVKRVGRCFINGLQRHEHGFAAFGVFFCATFGAPVRRPCGAFCF